MSETTTSHPVLEETTVPTLSSDNAPSPWRLILYLAITLGVPALFLLSSILIVRSSSFPAEAGDPFLLNLDYPFSLKGANCEVVIYGDSTAITGVDPTVVERDTGLTTCSIAQSQSILEIAGPIALDTYLKQNAAPKYLVIQLAPETLSRKRQSLFWPEGLTILLRRRPLQIGLMTMLRHPVEAYGFAMWAIKAKVAAVRGQVPDFASTEKIFHSHRGLLSLPKQPEKACSRQLEFWPPSKTYVNELRQRYGTSGTQVLMNVSPIPDCAPHATEISAAMKGVSDNSLPLYPIHLFCDLDRHLTMEGAERSSAEIAKEILEKHFAAPAN